MAQGSRRAVVLAIAGNGVITILKFIAAVTTHSAAMMNEAVHSLMDTLNQVFLLMGLIRGGRPADHRYAFGHGQKKYLWNLWSAIGLFSIGCGLGLSHSWHAYQKAVSGDLPVATPLSIGGWSLDPVWVSAVVLLISLVIEGYVLLVAGREFVTRMRAENISSPFRYLANAEDPTLVAVVLEDTIAVSGVLLATSGIALARITGDPVWDIAFSVVIALMLGFAAFFLGMVNMRFLTNIRDPEAEQAFRAVVAAHPEVDRFHDLRSVIVDENHTVVVAEVELREEVMIRGLRRRIAEIETGLLQHAPANRRADTALREYAGDRAAVQATLERAEQVIDELETDLRRRCPQVSHITIEVEGIAAPTVMETES